MGLNYGPWGRSLKKLPGDLFSPVIQIILSTLKSKICKEMPVYAGFQ